MSNTGWAAVIVGLVIILGLGWWFFSTQAPATTDTTATVNTPAPTETGGTGDATGVEGDASVDVGLGEAPRATVRYTSSGFSPANLTVAAGTAVSFINDTSGPMWVAADEHPTHTQYDNTDRATHCSGSYSGATPFDQCQPGTSYTFLFGKAGTFDYHNHSASQFGGTITVR